LTPAGVEIRANLAWAPLATRKDRMDNEALRLLIRTKLADGHLPQNNVKWLVRAPSDGHRCDACAIEILVRQHLIQGATGLGRTFRFHLLCFYLWDEERQVLS
jgi:hypothetical protein